MVRLIACCHVVLAVSIGASSAGAQVAPHNIQSVIRQIAAASQSEVRGTVTDSNRQGLAGAVVSAVGSTSAFAVTERDGSFVLRNLPSGAYMLRVHLQGYVTPRARVVQVDGSAMVVGAIVMGAREDGRTVLEAGVGGVTTGRSEPSGDATLDQSEVAWRLRHLRRSILKDEDIGEFLGDAADVPGAWTPVYAARHAGQGSWLAELPLYGRVDLLTSTSFDRPEDLLSLDIGAPAGLTSVALAAPTAAGDWSVQAGLTQGDIASWLVSSAFTRRGQTAHHYEAGISYGAQRYLGGNAFLLASFTDGTRNVGEVFASDRWTMSPHVEVTYGAKFARYDYLRERALLSPSASVTITPDPESSLRIHASAARREVAPGAGEFLAPSAGPWLPAQRAFSPLSSRNGFQRQRVDSFEVSAERQWAGDFVIGVRAFRQDVDGQMVTLFGLPQAGAPVGSTGHYFVGAGGDFEAMGWGLSFTRRMLEGVRASVDYSVTEATWVQAGADSQRLSRLASSTVRTDTERVYDLTAAIESEVAPTDTRFYVLYKINSAFASAQAGDGRGVGARFDVQVNQGLPFMRVAASQWEMLVAVRNMFHEASNGTSVYDELLVVRAPKRIVCGLSVRF